MAGIQYKCCRLLSGTNCRCRLDCESAIAAMSAAIPTKGISGRGIGSESEIDDCRACVRVLIRRDLELMISENYYLILYRWKVNSTGERGRFKK